MLLKTNTAQNLLVKNVSDVLARNLSYLMAKNKVSESDIVKATKISPATIFRILRGETADPGLSKVVLLSNYFDISIDSLLSEDLQGKKLERYALHLVPLLSWDNLSWDISLDKIEEAHRGNWEVFEDYDNSSLIPDFAIPAKKSMKTLSPGTILFVRLNEKPVDGDMALIKFENSDIPSLRELEIDPPTIQLLPTTSSSEIITFNESAHQIIGVVTQTKFISSQRIVNHS